MSRARRVLAGFALLVAVPLAVVVVAFAAQVTIDASRWRDAFALRATDALARPIVVQGPLRLTLGRELVLRIGGLRVGNPSGFEAKELLSVGDATVRIGWIDALRGQARLRSVEASDIGVWLERAADGRGNWELAPPRAASAAPRAFDLERIHLSRLALRYRDPRSAARATIDLDEVDGSAGSEQPLRLALRGRLPGQQGAYLLRVGGGALRPKQDGSQPWPFSLAFEAAGARLHADGELDAAQGETRFRLDTEADDATQIGRLLGASLPQSGAAALNGSVIARTDALLLEQVHGRLGESEFSGQLSLRWGGARQRLSGDLSVAVLDLRPWLEGGDDPPAWQAIALREIVSLDLDLQLSIERLLGLPVAVRDTKLGLQADARGVQAPMVSTVAGAQVSGQLRLDTVAVTPTFALDLAAQDLPLDALARALVGVEGIEGRARSVDLRFAGRGQTLGELARGIELSLAATAVQASLARADDA